MLDTHRASAYNIFCIIFQTVCIPGIPTYPLCQQVAAALSAAVTTTKQQENDHT